ncbi:MAG: gamma-glutamyltransferase, partial [Alphaproteobacteria bacterium]|nr:gamma-glutamyltransferase [Alphaproteobacteria bacterium]
TLVNPALAATFRAMATHGVEDFYRGETARKIVEAVRNAPVNPGDLTMDDLAGYAIRERPLLCRPYHGYTVCSMTPPSSGGITMLQALGMLEHHDLTTVQPDGVQAVHLISQATMLAFADRDRYIADPDFVEVPTEALLDPAYLAERAKLISWGNVTAKPTAGVPPQLRNAPECPGVRHAEVPNTTHFSIIDAEGNAVAMTSSVEYAFGSGMVAAGFILNNHMTDFAASPVDARGCKAVNRIEPNKRPRSSMSPTLVFDKAGNLVMTVGSPGGPRIIPYVLQTVIAVIDWKLGIQDAMNLPHYTNLTGKTELEEGTPIARLKPALEKLGHEVVVREMNSGLHGVMVTPGKVRTLLGGDDPRREGVALAD